MRQAARRLLKLAAAGLLLLLALWLALAPSEARLGNVIKLIYLHGALVWVGLITFSVAGALGLVALVVRRPGWYRGTKAASRAALVIWLLYALSAIVVTGLSWGQWIAWNEPRVRATGLILLAALAIAGVVWLVDQRDLTAAANLVMGIAPWLVVRQAEVIRHPVDPIGSSPSASIQTYYLLIVATVAALAVLLVSWLWLTAED